MDHHALLRNTISALEDIGSEKYIEFLQFYHRHKNGDDIYCFQEISKVAGVSDEMSSMLSTALFTSVKTIVKKKLYIPAEFEGVDKDGERESMRNVQAAHETLGGITSLLLSLLDHVHVSPRGDFLSSCISLHSIIIELVQIGADTLANDICMLCEQLYKKDQVAIVLPQTVSYLINRVLSNTAPLVKDINRLYSFRAALSHLSLSDSQSHSLQRLLLRLLIHPEFVRHPHGQHFLSFVYTLDPVFMATMHTTIKCHIATSSPSQLEGYARVYFLAFRDSPPATLESFEKDCIQDIMATALIAADSAVFSALFAVLKEFHRHKTISSVESMLLRLYEPILFRSLKTANPRVRSNALQLFSDAFPLVFPEEGRKEKDERIQMQMQLFDSLLLDPAERVRTLAIRSICKVMNIYWEVLPLALLQHFVVRLIDDLAHDASSPLVRACVPSSLKLLLDNHLSIPILHQFLPKLSFALYDNSEKVQEQFIRLLLVVKNIKHFCITDIVNKQSLLERLAVEKNGSTPLILLTELLLPTYFPQEASSRQLIERCLSFLEESPAAAFRFYSHIYLFTSLSDLLRLACRLFSFLQLFLHLNNDEAEKRIAVENVAFVKDVVRITATLLDPLQTAKNKEPETYKEHLHHVLEIFDDTSLSRLFILLSHEGSASLVLDLAGSLPEQALQSIALKIIPLLHQAACLEKTAEDLRPIIHCLFEWNRADILIGLLLRWLNISDSTVDTTRTVTTTKKHAISPENEYEDNNNNNSQYQMKQIETALTIFNLVLQNEKFRLQIFPDESILSFLKAFQAFLPLIRQRCHGNSPIAIAVDDNVLLYVLATYSKLLIHERFLEEDDPTDSNESVALLELFSWFKDSIAPCLLSVPQDPSVTFPVQVISCLMIFFYEFVALGFALPSTSFSIVEQTKHIIAANIDCLKKILLPHICRFLWHLFHKENEELITQGTDLLLYITRNLKPQQFVWLPLGKVRKLISQKPILHPLFYCFYTVSAGLIRGFLNGSYLLQE